jgi:hypothetical protein
MSKEEMRLPQYTREFAAQDLEAVKDRSSSAERNTFLAYCVYKATRKYGRAKGPDYGSRCALVARFARRNRVKLHEAGLLEQEDGSLRLDPALLDVLLESFDAQPRQAPSLLLSCEGCDFDYDRVIDALNSRRNAT